MDNEVWYLQTSDGQYIEGTWWELIDIIAAYCVKRISQTEGETANGIHYYMKKKENK